MSSPGAPPGRGGPVGAVMVGGGARGAYEAGALVELGPVLERRGEWPTVFTGASVGAINALTAAGLSAMPLEERLELAVARWRDVVKPHVFQPIIIHLPRLLARYAADIVLRGQGRVHSLLDPSPLDDHLHRWVDWDAIRANVRDGTVHAAAAIVAGAFSGTCVVLWDGRAQPRDGAELRYVRTRLRTEHLRAATAIPVLFPAVHLDEHGASGWFLDGSTRLRSPVRPALALGAERLVVFAAGSFSSASGGAQDSGPQPTLADAAATALHAMALDPLRDDLRALERDGRPHVAIGPQRPGAIGTLAMDVLRENYRSARGTLRDLSVIDRLTGGDSPLHGELLSFLLFDRDFIDELLAMGRRDARRWLKEHPDVWT